MRILIYKNKLERKSNIIEEKNDDLNINKSRYYSVQLEILMLTFTVENPFEPGAPSSLLTITILSFFFLQSS